MAVPLRSASCAGYSQPAPPPPLPFGAPLASLLRRLLLLTAIAGGYALLLALGPGREVGRMLLPNLWLLLCCGLWLRRRPLLFAVLHGGQHTVAMLAVCGTALLLLLLFTWWWPLEHPLPAAAQWLPLLLLVPPTEELAFRGVLLSELGREFGWSFAILFTSLLFGLAHAAQGASWPMAFLSLGLCAAALFSRSLLWPTALHLTWNALAILRTSPQGPDRWWIAALAAALVLGLAAHGWRSRARTPEGCSPC